MNLIAYNPIDEEDFKCPGLERVAAFKAALEQRHVAVSERASRGLDENAACGQLRRRVQAASSPEITSLP